MSNDQRSTTSRGEDDMNSRMFLDTVVRPNVLELFKDHGDLRIAVNAILTLDAFFGILFAELKAKNEPAVADIKDGKDDEYRDKLAGLNKKYQVLRDTAASLKHGKLTTNKARLVKTAGQVYAASPGAGVMMAGHDRLNEPAVLIQVPNSNSFERPEFVVADVLKLAESELAAYSL